MRDVVDLASALLLFVLSASVVLFVTMSFDEFLARRKTRRRDQDDPTRVDDPPTH